MHDTMEDAVAGPDVRAILKHARVCITASRTAVVEGGSSDRHIHAFVDTVILYVLSVIQRARQATSQIKCDHSNVKKFF